MRTGSAAVVYARRVTHWRVGMCLNFVRTCLGLNGKYPSAISAWNNAQHRHGPGGTPPVGVPVFFRGGRYGHVALSVGGGKCRSTDWPRAGVVSEVAISTLAKAWNYPYLGWTEDLNDVRIYGASGAVAKPIVVQPVAVKPTMFPLPWSTSYASRRHYFGVVDGGTLVDEHRVHNGVPVDQAKFRPIIGDYEQMLYLPRSGRFRSTLAKAVAKYQKDHGITVDPAGRIGLATHNSLFQNRANLVKR